MTNKPMLPCPFCGSDPFPLEWPDGGDTGEVRCLEPGCPIDDVFIPIEQWNRPRMKVPVNSEAVAVFGIDHSGYRARVVLDPAKPFPPDGTLLYAEQPAPISVVMAGQLNTFCDPGCPYRGEPKCCRELVEARNRVKP